jgi:hypothetical protein
MMTHLLLDFVNDYLSQLTEVWQGADLFGCNALDVAETIARKKLVLCDKRAQAGVDQHSDTIPCPNHNTVLWNEARNRVGQ